MNLIFLITAVLNLVTAQVPSPGSMYTHDFKMTYDNVNDVVIMTCVVPKD